MSVNQPGSYVLNTVLPVLSTVAVAARFYVRHSKKAGFGADDWTALASLVGLWSIAGVLLDGTRKGLIGTHSQMDPETGGLSVTVEGGNVQLTWIVTILTTAALMLIKMSVMLLYRRLFHISRFFRFYSTGLCILLGIWGTGFVFAYMFLCGTHPQAYWGGLKMYAKYCGDTSSLNVAHAFSDVIFDILILLAPASMIWGLNISTARKVQVLAVFALGFMSTAAASVRTYIMWVDAYGTTPGFRDVLNENTRVTIWCMVEVSCALLGCCMPTLRPLVANSSVGSMLRSLRTILSLPSQSNQMSAERKAEDGIAFATIGGTDFTGRKSDANSQSSRSMASEKRV